MLPVLMPFSGAYKEKLNEYDIMRYEPVPVEQDKP